MAGRLSIGVDVGGTTIKFGVVREDGTIVQQEAVPTMADGGPDAVLGRISDGVKPLLASYGADVAGIGLGVPGVINNSGEIAYPPNFPGWEIVPVAERLRPLIGTDIPIAVENDANVAAFAELSADATGSERDFLFVTLGTGVGGCIISGGKIWRGASGGAGEVGHITVDINGQLCNCGARGCVEAYLGQRYMSAAATARLVRHPDSSLKGLVEGGHELDPKLLHEAAAAGDQFALDFLAEMGMILGAALASAMNLCDLHLVIVGGGTAKSGDYLLEPARRSMQSRLLKSIARDARMRPARFSNDAGIIGAAMLGLSVVSSQ